MESSIGASHECCKEDQSLMSAMYDRAFKAAGGEEVAKARFQEVCIHLKVPSPLNSWLTRVNPGPP
eukprot:5492251-Amphidinium_carterae.1